MRMLRFFLLMEVLEGYIMVLFVDGDAIFEHQNQWLSDVED
jgi:hypothetical protein